MPFGGSERRSPWGPEATPQSERLRIRVREHMDHTAGGVVGWARHRRPAVGGVASAAAGVTGRAGRSPIDHGSVSRAWIKLGHAARQPQPDVVGLA